MGSLTLDRRGWADWSALSSCILATASMSTVLIKACVRPQLHVLWARLFFQLAVVSMSCGMIPTSPGSTKSTHLLSASSICSAVSCLATTRASCCSCWLGSLVGADRGSQVLLPVLPLVCPSFLGYLLGLSWISSSSDDFFALPSGMLLPTGAPLR